MFREGGFHLTLLVLSLLQRIDNPFLPALELINSDFVSEFKMSLGCLIMLFFENYANEASERKICDLNSGNLVATESRYLFPVLHPVSDEEVHSGVEVNSQEEEVILGKLGEMITKILNNEDLRSYIVI